KIPRAFAHCSINSMPSPTLTSRRDPDARGYFGEFGGRFVPETLVEPVEQLERAYFAAREDAQFGAELARLLKQYVGRPTPVYETARLEERAGGARIFLKREDLTHTGAHKINNALGQALLAARMGKRRIVAETGAGQHGVATATACALLGLECHVYMGAEDMARQALNVFRMHLLGAGVRRVDAGGSAGVLQGTRTFVLQDEDGNIELTHSISAGLDYAAVGPEHAWLRAQGRAEYAHVTDAEALDAFQQLARLEGILPALESAHAVAYARHVAKELGPSGILLVNLSGRG